MQDRNLPTASVPEQADAAARGRWFAVAVLVIVGVLNYVDRELPYILADSMKAELALSDTALGFINGMGFLVIYAVMGIPLARLSDRGRYGLVISGAVGFWSLMTAAGAACQNGWQLAAARMGVAVGESGSMPAAHAYVARNFPAHKRGVPLAFVAAAGPIGAMTGLLGGGYLDEAFGWRGAFLVMGAIGLLLAAVVPFVVKGARLPPPAGGAPKLLGGIPVLLKNRSYLRLILAAALSAFATYAIGAFSPSLLRREYGMAPSEIGVTLGLTKGVMGITALIVGGLIVDRLAARNPAWMPRLPAILTAIALPVMMTAWMTHDRTVAVIALAAAATAGPASMVAVIAGMQGLVPPHLRATASAFLFFANAMIGGLGPVAVGAMSDFLTPELGQHALRQALLIVPAVHVLTVLTYLWTSRDFARDMYREG